MRCTIHMVSAAGLPAVHRGRARRSAGTGGCARDQAARRARHARGRRRGPRLPGRRPAQAGRDPGPAAGRRASPRRPGRACSCGWTWSGCRRPAPGARRARTSTAWPSTPCRAPDPPPTEAGGRGRCWSPATCAAFGPASARDIASFCGWNVTATRAVLAGLELRRFRDEAGGELLDVPEAPLPAADTPAPVRFLGQWDAILLVHARRGADPARGVPAAGVRHVDPAVGADLPGRRPGGRHLAVCRRGGPVRAVPRAGPRRAGPSWTRRRTGWPPSTATAEPAADQWCVRAARRAAAPGPGRPAAGPGRSCWTE